MRTKMAGFFAGLFLVAATAGAQVSNVSLVPSYGPVVSGTPQVFTATYSDALGYSDISDAEVLFRSAIGGIVSACYVSWSDSSYAFYLANDAGTGWLGPVPAWSGSTVQNSQCKLYGNGSSVSGSDNQLTMNVKVSFFSPFAGSHYIQLSASSYMGYTAALQTMGTVTVWTGIADLTIHKTHAGNFTQGQTGAQYTITVDNIGTGSINGVTVTDTLPTGITASAISGSGWNCSLSPLSCTCSDLLVEGHSYPAITLTVNVAANAPTSVTNRADVSSGADSNLNNNTANDPTTIYVSGGTPNLTITNTHAGDFRPGQQGATYTIVAGNNGTATTNATVTVSDALPTGLTATGIAGTGWTCTQPGGPCMRSDALAVGNSYSALTLTVNVAANAAVRVTNSATASGGGDPTSASADDLTSRLTV